MSETTSPEVTVRGPGDGPEVTVVGGIHGDEPSGVRAIERVLDADHEFRRRVQFVRANPAALERNVRYVDVDLNRVFPGDPDSDDLERRLAAELCGLLGDTPTLSLHATHSQPEPMTLISRTRPRAVELAADLPSPAVVDVTDVVDGSLTTCGPVVTVEAGCQHSDAAADAATEMVEAFLACSDVFDLHVENFERVPAGEHWATADGERLVADAPFVPILMSECGYQDIFGYKGHVAGETLAEARANWRDPPQE